MKIWAMTLVLLAGLMGAAGVAAGAAAAHVTGGGSLQTASIYLLIHAAAAAAIGLNLPAGRLFLLSGSLLAVGAILFGGDIALRALAGVRLFPMAAPAGGIILIVGWLALAAAAPLHLAAKSADRRALP